MTALDISAARRNDIFGLCRERVPLGVIARGLSLPARSVKVVAGEFHAAGLIGEMPADDIRAGLILSWPEKMLPDAPDMADEPAQPAPLSPKQTHTVLVLRRIAPGSMRWSVADFLAGRTGYAYLSSVTRHVGSLGFDSSADSVKVTISNLRKCGLKIDYWPGRGYLMQETSRDLWAMAMGGVDA